MPRRFLFIPFAKQHRKTMEAGSDVENTLCCQNTATALQNRRLISERGAAWRVLNQWVQDTHTHKKCDVKNQHNLPSATSQALRNCEWWAFFTSLSARIFSKARVRNMFFVFLPSNMSHRNMGRGVPGPKGGAAAASNGRCIPLRMSDAEPLTDKHK